VLPFARRRGRSCAQKGPVWEAGRDVALAYVVVGAWRDHRFTAAGEVAALPGGQLHQAAERGDLAAVEVAARTRMDTGAHCAQLQLHIWIVPTVIPSVAEARRLHAKAGERNR
jgi:hypothetical protein